MSYTVEAAFIMPVMMFCIAKGMIFGIDLCREQQDMADSIVQQEQRCAVEVIRRYELYEDIWNYVMGEDKDAD